MSSDLLSSSRFQSNQRQLKRLQHSVRKAFDTRPQRPTPSNREKKVPLETISKHPELTKALVHEVSEVPPTPPSSYPSTPKSQRALTVARKGEYELVDDFRLHQFQNEDEVMIRSVAVGLNPIDWKSVSYNFCLPDFPWVCHDA
jgi:hypothetical protein